MARPKKIIETVEEIVETKVETVEATESEEKKAFRNLIEAYKVQNPTKYETKKEELLAQLNSLN